MASLLTKRIFIRWLKIANLFLFLTFVLYFLQNSFLSFVAYRLTKTDLESFLHVFFAYRIDIAIFLPQYNDCGISDAPAGVFGEMYKQKPARVTL